MCSAWWTQSGAKLEPSRNIRLFFSRRRSPLLGLNLVCPERAADRVVRSPSAAPTTPAEEESGASSGSDSSEVSGVSGESQLEGEGVAEAIGVIRACQDKGVSLWTPGVICRLFETPELPHNVFPGGVKAMEEQAGSAGDAAAPDAAAASTDVAAGAAAVPPTPGTEAKSPPSYSDPGV